MADLNWNSRNLTHGWQKGVTAFYYGLGFDDADFNRAQIGIGTPLLDGNLCNVHAYELAKQIAQGCKDAGLIGLPFGTPAVSDNITQGQEGGNASLPSRNMIANGAEAVVSAHSYDGLIGLHNCDKNGPGFAMALARLNYPGLIVSGGSIMPGCHNDQDITILDVYDSQAALSVGATTQEDADHILRNACPGAGGCALRLTRGASAWRRSALCCPLLVDPGHRRREAHRVPAGRSGAAPPARARHPSARHTHAAGLHQCSGSHGRGRRFDQRDFAPAGAGP